jgi:hypothetical protein
MAIRQLIVASNRRLYHTWLPGDRPMFEQPFAGRCLKIIPLEVRLSQNSMLDPLRFQLVSSERQNP